MVFLTAGQRGKCFSTEKSRLKSFAVQDKESDFQKFSESAALHQKSNYQLGLGKNVLLCLFLFDSFVELSLESIAVVLCSCFKNVLEKEIYYFKCEAACSSAAKLPIPHEFSRTV